MRTFGELQTLVLRYFDVASEEDGSADVELVKGSLNTANATRASEDKWKFMLSAPKTLSVTSGTAEYILPDPNLLKLHYLYSTTNKRFVRSVPMRSVPYMDVEFRGTTTDRRDNLYYEITDGGAVVARQPTNAETIRAISSAAEDAGVATLYIEGLDTNGNFISETVEANAVSSQIFSSISYYAKSDDWAGSVTVSTNTFEELVVVPVGEAGKEYPVLRFLNTPSADETFQYRYFRKPRLMTRSNDRPDLPYPHSNLLLYDALLDLATYNELDSESVNIWRDKQTEILNVLYQQKLEADTVGGEGMYINELGNT